MLCSSPHLLAQTGSFSGTVTDSTGSLVPKAKITATNVATGISRDTETDESGTYRLTNMSPGVYDVTIEHGGFKTVLFSHISLNVDEVLTLDTQLVVSTVKENVVVNSNMVSPVDLNDAQTGNLVNSRQMTDLPLILRDPYQLILLSPGVIQSNTLFSGFSVNGSRERSNNFLLDGSDNNDPDFGGFPRGLSTLNPETTQEFRVITNGFLPEFGRNSGAIIDIVTKHGTNSFHGDVYWFGRYTALSAKDFFAQDRNQEPFVRNQFGYSVGGPIRKNQTFFFLNQEFERFSTTILNASIVPTAAFKTGVFTYEGQTVNVSTPGSANNGTGLPLDPVVQQILALYPNPNGQILDGARGILHFPSHSLANGDNVTARVDHDFRGGGILSLRYTYNQYSDSNYQHEDFLPGLGGVSTNQHNNNISLLLTSSIKNTITNEVHGGANRLEFPLTCTGVSTFDSLSPALDAEGRGVDYTMADSLIAGFGCLVLGDSDGSTRNAGTYTAGDNLSWVMGRHTVKFGAEYRGAYSNSSDNYVDRTLLDSAVFSNFGIPATTGTGLEEDPTLQNLVWTLFGGVDLSTQAQFFDTAGVRTPTDLRGFRQNDYAGFGQDSYKLSSNVTFTYGLRYEYFGVPTEVNNELSTLLTSPSGTGPFTFTRVGNGPGMVPLYQNNYNGLEPRVSAAWDPFRNGKTSIRAGYGIYRDRVFGQLISQLRADPPYQMLETLPCDGLFASPPYLPACTLSAQSALPTFQSSPTVSSCQLGEFCSPILPYLIQQNLKNPYTQTWSLGIQRELYPSLMVEISYVGSKGTDLLRLVDGNPPQPQLVQALEQFCVPTNPQNVYQCTQQTLQFSNLWLGADELNPATGYPLLPFNATNNNAFLNAELYKSIASSAYNALQMNVTKRISHGFSIQGAYTWSHAIDNASDPLVPAAGNQAFPRDSLDLAPERGNSDFDVRQRLVMNYTWQLPMGNGSSKLNQGAGGWLLANWAVSGITTFSSGLPYDLFTNVDTQHTGFAARPFYNPSAVPTPSSNPGTQTGPSLAYFSDPSFGLPGNIGRNLFRGPGINNWDSVITKRFGIRERFNLDMRFEFYNLFNRVQFNQPDNYIYDGANFGHSSSEYVRPDGTTGARQIQMALKLSF